MNFNITSEQIDIITKNLNNNGFHCLENVFDKNLQSKFNSYVDKLLDLKGKRYFSIVNIFKNKKTPFAEIYLNKNFNFMMKELCKNILKREVEADENLSILRVVTGKNSEKQKLNFHYDAYALTALIPIMIPSGKIEDCGHLVAFANVRNIRSSFVVNFIEKTLIQNPLIRKFLSIIIKNNVSKYTYVMDPGNIYLFWGYRTIHANHLVKPNKTRCTLLYHYGEVHKNSKLDKYIKQRRYNLELKNSEKLK